MITNHSRETPEATACRGRPRSAAADTAIIEIATRINGDIAAANALLTAPLTL